MRASVATLLSFAGVHAQELFLGRKTAEPSREVDVVIIGAGWAGMAAADSLARANVSFVVLEASNHTGGRSHAFEFGHPSVGKFVFEQGSNWVHGAGGGAAGATDDAPNAPHPVHELALREGLRMTRIPGSADGNMSNYAAVFDVNGRDADATGELRRRANAAIDCLNETAQTAHNVTVMTNLRTALEACGWSPSTDVEWAMDWQMTVDESGEPARLNSLSATVPDQTYMWWGPDDWFITDQHPRGYARLIDAMVRDSVPAGDPRVVLGARVDGIEWGCDGVVVSTSDGRSFKAAHAISTVSIGVLQRRHQELFSPALPKKHAAALSKDHVVMGNLSHVLVQFPHVWWNNSLTRWVSANRGGHGQAGQFTHWDNLNHESLVPGSQTLLSFLGDPEASKYEGMPDADIQAAVIERLRLQHPDLDVPDAVAFYISRWGYDPNFYGSYSVMEPGFRDKFIDAIKKPLKACGKTVVRFAGEATCDNLNGYTHGAYQTGKEAAAHFLHETGKGPNPDKDDKLSLCGW